MAEIIVLFAAFDWIFRGGFVLIFQSAARVAELVDAHGSGPCDLTIMGVRVPPRAPVRPGQETGPVFCCLARFFVALPGLLGLVLPVFALFSTTPHPAWEVRKAGCVGDVVVEISVIYAAMPT